MGNMHRALTRTITGLTGLIATVVLTQGQVLRHNGGGSHRSDLDLPDRRHLYRPDHHRKRH